VLTGFELVSRDCLKSRSNLSDDEIERMNEDDAWRWIRANASAGERAEETPGDS
jgi:hypothetical protein